MDGAASGGHLDVVKWLHTRRSEGCTMHAMNGAASGGHVEVVKWLHSNRQTEVRAARQQRWTASGRLHAVRWLHENRSEGCTTAAMKNAIKNEQFEIVLLLHRMRSEGCSRQEVVVPRTSDMYDWVNQQYPGLECSHVVVHFNVGFTWLHRFRFHPIPSLLFTFLVQSNPSIPWKIFSFI
ncbi:hypothetical protein JG688_00008062 [Phytophthora aleatoria]|uniref:Uncharacterized protein n=1 Tax=Phytophthora aleatoria TaxID=2496075 RepID=A0A8J5J568_9STRA|nr:hypothetical protein JG688_00008062 [Phytophthora aleatoria]